MQLPQITTLPSLKLSWSAVGGNLASRYRSFALPDYVAVLFDQRGAKH